ncbi:MAG: hypothetical protein ABFC96_15940 [Thermoguttaceae bacterium]
MTTCDDRHEAPRSAGCGRWRRARRGFTLLEVSTASGLTIFLAMVLSSAWAALSRPTSELIAWSQLFQEMDLAVASLSRDFGGSLPDFRDVGGGLGTKRQGRLLECKRTEDGHLWLCYDGGASPDGLATWDEPSDDTRVEYYVDPTTDRASNHFQRLIRVKHEAGAATSFTVARYVQSMIVTEEGADSLRIVLNFQFVNYTPKGSSQPLGRQCILIVKKNP